ncbi:glycosyltransferase family 4 protein [Actinomyces minihominis]|uniref:glycosyltransferase family 4 protein n=1 Tax=Actinomyces minihominis TaxID=2002838 RepID=UPI000C075837|nr:glycosyltransferase family 4 protein [Actinomyces minihominis]
MKVAMIVNSFPPRVGGLERHVDHLTQGLAKLGHEVTVVTLDSSSGRRKRGSVRVYTGKAHFPIADIISFPAWGTTKRLAKFLKQNHIDVVATHTRFFPMSYVGMRAARRAGIPIIHTEHGSDFVASGSFAMRLASRMVDYTLGRAVMRGASHVLGVSEEVIQFVKRLSGRNAGVFYNAIVAPESESTAVHQASHLVFVGRVVEGKGWDDYLSAFAQLRDEGYPVTGALLGDGPDLDQAREMARKLGVDQLVDIRGRADSQEVREELRGATLVNPSVLSEGFQIVMLEAVAEGGRVVAYPVPGSRRLVAEGFPVLVATEKSVPALVSTLRQMLENPLKPSGAEEIAKWTWEARSEEYASTLEDVLKNARPRGMFDS